jgi:hypothetical protein
MPIHSYMKLLPVFLCVFLLAPSSTFAKNAKKKATNQKMGQEKEFSWQDESTWGAHPPSAEDLGPQGREEDGWDGDYDDQDFSWDDEDSWGAHPPSDEDMDRPTREDRYHAESEDHAHHPRHKRERENRVDYYDYLAMKMAYRCGKAKKTQDDCHACTDSTADFNACMAGETEKPSVVNGHDYKTKAVPHFSRGSGRVDSEKGAKAAK